MKSAKAKQAAGAAIRGASGATNEGDGTRTVTFVFGGEAAEVVVAGDFNGWDQKAHPMKRGKDGVWTSSLMLAPGTYEYRLIVDGAWAADPACHETRPNAFGTMNCVVTVGWPRSQRRPGRIGGAHGAAGSAPGCATRG